MAADVTSQSKLQRQYIYGLANELGLEFLDITDYLQAAVPSSPLAYYPANVHLTKQGHALIARALESTLSRLGIPGAEHSGGATKPQSEHR